MVSNTYAAWQQAVDAGDTALMMAADNATVRELNTRAPLLWGVQGNIAAFKAGEDAAKAAQLGLWISGTCNGDTSRPSQ